jgi:hypothetical protein
MPTVGKNKWKKKKYRLSNDISKNLFWKQFIPYSDHAVANCLQKDLYDDLTEPWRIQYLTIK